MKRFFVCFVCLLVMLLFVPVRAAHASPRTLRTAHGFSSLAEPRATHVLTPLLSNCETYKTDAACNGQWPDVSGCWNYDGYIYHQSGWTDERTGTAMFVDLYRSNYCHTEWSEVGSVNNSVQDIYAGVYNVTDSDTQPSAIGLTQSFIWSPMINTANYSETDNRNEGVYAYGSDWYADGPWHTTPTYSFA